ncbi:MAG: hypothetical protein WD712_00110 [Candidatus Spechtbacterales bacterium]
MTKRTRTILFGVFLSLFLLSILPMVLFTKGYRVDLDNLKLVETGGIDLNINTADTKVYLDAKLKRETSFIFKNAVFRNILPGNYDIAIEKNNYKKWQKTISVEAGRVSKFLDIRLFPNKMPETLLAENTNRAFLSPNLRFGLLESEGNISGEIKAEKGIQILLSDNARQTLQPILTLQPDEYIKEILWSWNSDIFFIFGQGAGGNFLYSGSAGRAQELKSWNSFLRNSFPNAYSSTNIRVSSNSADVLYVLQRASDNTFSLNSVDLSQRIIRADILKGIISFNIIDDNIFYISKEGVLFVTNITTSETKQLSSTAISRADANAKLIVREDSESIMIINRGDLFLWESEKPFLKIAGNTVGAAFSPDKEKILYWDGGEVKIYWLKEVFGPPSRVPGDTETISGYSEIKTAGWISGSASYVVFQTADKIVFAELDSRDKRNVFEYPITTFPGVFGIDSSVQRIYTLINGDLVSLRYD